MDTGIGHVVLQMEMYQVSNKERLCYLTAVSEPCGECVDEISKLWRIAVEESLS